MRIPIIAEQKPIGSIELGPDSFDISGIEEIKYAKVLLDVLNEAYASGIVKTDEHNGETELLKPDDPRFVLELGLKLATNGYRFA